jgi:hypothetical protein
MEYSRLSLINEVFDIVDSVIEEIEESGVEIEDWAFRVVKDMVSSSPERKSSEFVV